MENDTHKQSAIRRDDTYPSARQGAVPMGRHFTIWVRPSRSIMPWRPLADRSGAVVVKRDAGDANACAVQAMEGGSVCAMVCETLLPLEPSPTLHAVLIGSERVELLDY